MNSLRCTLNKTGLREVVYSWIFTPSMVNIQGKNKLIRLTPSSFGQVNHPNSLPADFISSSTSRDHIIIVTDKD